jgi:23S rRNA pseudouridine2457 synthase
MPLILLNKPFRTLCQFRDNEGRSTLADYVATAAVYPAGRLDFESEGLVLLTDDGRLQARIAEPRQKLMKRYTVQVEGIATDEQVAELKSGVTLKDGRARAVNARLVSEPQGIWDREPPIRSRKTVPTSWIEVELTEGRNRQVRRMTAAVGLPALRLIRYQVGPWQLEELRPGESKEISTREAWRKLESY